MQNNLITSDTFVTFHKGDTNGNSTILHICPYDKDPAKSIIIVRETPFHPVDHNWPDQPEDRGNIEIDAKSIPVINCLVAAFNKISGELFAGDLITAKRGDPHFYWLVAHIVLTKDIENFSQLIGKQINLKVDQQYRFNLSKIHTACHLAALALNKVTSTYWKKEVANKDSLNNYDLDKCAVQKSEIFESEGREHFRIGKSMRKKGFDSLRFFNDLTLIQQKINQQLIAWISLGPLIIEITPTISSLTDKREWRCNLSQDGIAKIPCGGTHIDKILLTDSITVTLSQKDNDSEFIMNTHV